MEPWHYNHLIVVGEAIQQLARSAGNDSAFHVLKFIGHKTYNPYKLPHTFMKYFDINYTDKLGVQLVDLKKLVGNKFNSS